MAFSLTRNMMRDGHKGAVVWRRRALAVAVASCFNASVAVANPTGPAVAHGSAAIVTQGNTLTVTNAPGTIINWNSFSIAGGEVTRFIQQSQASSVLNRVVGMNPSAILGTLQSNGRVFLINPNGITFGAGARIDVAGLVASTLNISDGDFLSGRMRFSSGEVSGRVVNQGQITTESGGIVYLLGQDVENSGVIRSPKGEILLAAGKSIELADSQTPEIRVQLTAPANEALNIGQLIAEGGRIGMYGSLVRQAGVVNANTAVVGENGKIVFKATKDVRLEPGSVTSASGPSAGSVTIEAQTGSVTVAGVVEARASAARGGEIDVRAQSGVTLESSGRIDASGVDGGVISLRADRGAVVIKGSVLADGSTGNGGRVTVKASDRVVLSPAAQLSVSWGAGAGGSAHVSADQGILLEVDSQIHADGALGGGAITVSSGNGSVLIEGLVRASSGEGDGGTINIAALADITLESLSRLSVAGKAGGEVHVEARQGTTLVSGNVDSQGHDGPGGHVLLLGQRVGLIRQSRVNASGRTGGGVVLVGGDYQGKNADIANAQFTLVGPDTVINADALDVGDGGKVIVWSDRTTRFFGKVSARGGAHGGDGGFAEISGREFLVFSGSADLRAPVGYRGRLLLDPTNIEIAGASESGVTISNVDQFADADVDNSAGGADGTTNTIAASAIVLALDAADVTLQASNDITVSSAIDASANTGNFGLTLQAGNNIAVNAAVTTKNGLTLSARDPAGTQTVGGKVTVAAALDAGGGLLSITNNGGTGGDHQINANLTGTGVTVSGAATFGANAVLDGKGGTLSLANKATLGDGVTLTLGAGGATTINVAAIDNTTTANSSSLTFKTTGAVTVSGAVGGTNALNTLTVTNSNGATFSGAVTTDTSVVLGGSNTGTLSFAGGLVTPTLTANAGGYNVSLTGSATTVTNAVTFSNTGTVTLGDASTDVLTFSGGLVATAPAVTLNGEVRTAGQAISLGSSTKAVTLSGTSSILDTTNNGGTATGANITVDGAVDGAGDNTQSLTLKAGTGGVISFTSNAVVGGGTNTQPATLTVTNSNGATFSGAVTTDTSVVLGGSNTGTLSFAGGLVTPTLTANAGGYNVSLTGSATTVTNAVTFLNTGTLQFGDAAADVLLFNGGVTATAPSGVTLNGQLRTSGDAVSLGDGNTGVTLAGATSIIDTTNNGGTTAGAGITLGGAVNGTAGNTQSLTLNAGTGGAISASSTIGATTSLATLTVTNSNGATFSGAVTTGTSVVLTDTSDGQAIEFTGALTTPTLTTAAEAYNLRLLGDGTTITNAVTFLNTGTLQFGDAAADVLLFNGGVVATAPSSKTVNGTVTASGTGVINLGTTAVNVTGSSTIGGTSTGQITLGAATLSDGVTLTLGAGAATPIVTGAISGTASGAVSNLTINTTGAVTVGGALGTDIGTVTVTQSGGVAFNGTVDAGTIAITDTADGQAVSFTQNTNATTGMTVANAGSDNYNVSFTGGTNTIAGTTTFANGGTLTLGDGGDTINFTGGVVATAPSSKTVNGTVTASGTGVINLGTTAVNVTGSSTIGGTSTGQITLGAATLSDGVTLTLGAGAATPIVTGAISGTASGAVSNLTINTTGAVTVGGALGTDIGTVTVTQSGGVAFNGTVDAGTIAITDTADGQAVSFTQNTNATTGMTVANAGSDNYNVSFTGGTNTIAGTTTFANGGTLQLGDAAADVLLFNGGVTATAPSGVTLNGQLRTSGDAVSLGDGNTGVTLAGATSIIDTTNNGATGVAANVTVGGVINGTTVNTQSLTVNSKGSTNISAAVGGVTALSTLTTDAGGTVSLQSVTTSGAQSYGENATLSGTYTTTNSAFSVGGTTTLGGATTVTTGSGNVTFTGAVDGGQTLAVNSTGATLFSAAVGSTNALTSLTTNAGGTLALNGVSTTSAQTYGETTAVSLAGTFNTNNLSFVMNAPVTLTGGTTINAGSAAINFTGTVNGAQTLTANSTGTTTFAGAVGGTNALTSLTTNAGGTTQVNGASISTSGAQSYGDAVTVGAGPANTSFLSSGGAISFSQTLTGNGGDLTFGSSGQKAGALTVSGALTSVDDLVVHAASATIVNTGNSSIAKVAFNTTGNVSHYDQNGIALSASTIGGTLSLTAENGDIQQTGATTVSGSTTLTTNRGGIVTGGTGATFTVGSAVFTANDGLSNDSGTIVIGTGGLTATVSGGGVTLKSADSVTINGSVLTNDGNVIIAAGNVTGMSSLGISLASNSGGSALGAVTVKAPVRSKQGNITVYASGPVSQTTGMGVDSGLQTQKALVVRTFNDGADVATISLNNDNKTATSTNSVTPSVCSGVAAPHGAGNCAQEVTLETRRAGDTGTSSTTSFPGGFAASAISYKSISGTQIIGIGTASSVALEADSWTLSGGAVNGSNVSIVATGVGGGGSVAINRVIGTEIINNNQSGGSLNIFAARDINVNDGGAIGTATSKFDHGLTLAAGNNINLKGSIYLNGDLNLQANAKSTSLRGTTPLQSTGNVEVTVAQGKAVNLIANNITIGTAANPVNSFIATAGDTGTGGSSGVLLEVPGKLDINLSKNLTFTAGKATANSASTSLTSADVRLKGDEINISGGGDFSITAGTATLGANAGKQQEASAGVSIEADKRLQLKVQGSLSMAGGTVFAATGGNTAKANAELITKTAFLPEITGDLNLKGGVAEAQPVTGETANSLARAQLKTDDAMILKVGGTIRLTGGTATSTNRVGGVFAEADASAGLVAKGIMSIEGKGDMIVTGGTSTASGANLRAIASAGLQTGKFTGQTLSVELKGNMTLKGGSSTGAAADAAALLYSGGEAKLTIAGEKGLLIEGGFGPFFPPFSTGVFTPDSDFFHFVGDSVLVRILGNVYPITISGAVSVKLNKELGGAFFISEAPPLALDSLLAAFIKTTNCASFSGGSCTLSDVSSKSDGSTKAAAGGVCR